MPYQDPDFLQRLANNQLSEQEHAMFKRWLQGLSDEQMKLYLNQYEQYANAEKSQFIDKEAVATHIKQSIDQWEGNQHPKRTFNRSWIWRIAAMIALLIISWLLVYSYFQQKETMLAVVC